ncbi:sn-glycerol-3-phosphate transport system permease protein UgpE [Bacillus sp. J14TS2]|uniref:carbohydrate ABC transporter permease n=1 Tax=Bacillus sp. J14TS2 TaxID=2807188 RepID=UPI001B0F2544|nr:carbohydrate ABC transporter permease [Bacillus sp. J14TS2]GIN71461.1 sn-glycerol-3-phosphate transport system permease protein UgpE [Bacillus sp. J14TS2]
MSNGMNVFRKSGLYIIYLLVAFIFIGPIIYLFVASLKSDTQIISDMSSLKGFIPYGNLSFENYKSVLTTMDFTRYFSNSVIVTLCTVLFGTIINAMIGFSLGMLNFKGKKLLISIVIALTIIPTEAVIINRLMITAELNLLNTMAALILPSMAYPSYIFLYYTHFRGMPKELLEAAIMDGSGYIRSFFKIFLPLSKPIVATVAIMAFIRTWGDLLWPTLVLRDDSLRTLPLVLRSLFNSEYMQWGEIFAFGAMTTLPTLVIFMIFQKQFIQSVASSGIK